MGYFFWLFLYWLTLLSRERSINLVTDFAQSLLNHGYGLIVFFVICVPVIKFVVKICGCEKRERLFIRCSLHLVIILRQHQWLVPCDAMLAQVIAIATCLSVCPSITRRYCVKTKKASGMIYKTLVFRRQISSPNSKRFPPNGGFKEGSVGKIQRFFSFKHQYPENGSRYG